MTNDEYKKAIREAGKYVLLTDNVKTGMTNEIQKVFDTPESAHEYAGMRVPHTKNNRIDVYVTTGIENSVVDGIIVRNDIKPYQEHHIGWNW